MEYAFSKLHSTGNDFIIIDNRDGNVLLSQEQIVEVCSQHFGIGADGLILVEKSQKPACVALMNCFSNDGKPTSHLSGALRCFTKYLVDNGIVDVSAGGYLADTPLGTRTVVFTTDASGACETVKIDMGVPILEPEKIPTTLPAKIGPMGQAAIDMIFDLDDGLYSFSCVNINGPHAVTLLSDIDSCPVDEVGPEMENRPEFPERTSVDFAQVEGDQIFVRSWIRDRGEVLASAAGMCAATVIASIIGKSPSNVTVHMPGGSVVINWMDNGHIYLVSNVTSVFSGTFSL